MSGSFIVKLFLESVDSLSAATKCGLTPKMNGCFFGNITTIYIVIQKRINKNQSASFYLHYICIHS